MTAEQTIRLECLKLALPKDIANPDVEWVLERAKRFETFVTGSGQAHAAPARESVQVPSHKPGQGQHNGPRHQR